MKQTVASPGTIAVPTMPNVGEANPTVVEYAARIQSLKDEYETLKVREKEIQDEVQRLFGEFQTFQPLAGFDINPPKRNYPKRKSVPRTSDTKMLISSGRIVINGAATGQPKEATRKAAIDAAMKVAKNYGLEALPDSVTKKIEEQISKRYQS